MKLAVYTYNSEPYLWYPTPKVKFVNITRGKKRLGSKWDIVEPLLDDRRTPMELLPDFDAWMYVDPRVSELTVDFNEFLRQIETLNPNLIYGIGQCSNGFRTIGAGCIMEPAETDRSRRLLEFLYKTVLPDNRKYSTQAPLLTFSSILFFESPKVEITCRDAIDLTVKFPGLNPQVALNWTAWKNTVRIEPIEDIDIEQVHHRIWIKHFDLPVPREEEAKHEDVHVTWAEPKTAVSKLEPEQLVKVKQEPVVETVSKAVTLGESAEVKDEKTGHRNIEVEVREPQDGKFDNNLFLKLGGNSSGQKFPRPVKSLIGELRETPDSSGLPNVSVMMTTWNRTALAVKCLKELVKNIEYPKNKLFWVLADDGSEPGHVEACIDALTESGISIDMIYLARNYRTGEGARFGHAINLNNGMREAFRHSEIVLRTEDDLLAKRKIPVTEFAKILHDNNDVGGIKLAHAADAKRKLPWKLNSKKFEIDASYWNVYIFNHLAMICHKRVYDEIGMYNESLSGGQVEADIGKRFMEKFRERSPYSEYRMKILIPVLPRPTPEDKTKINWLYFDHIGKESVSGHKHRDKWSEETLKLNREEVAEEIRSEAARL